MQGAPDPTAAGTARPADNAAAKKPKKRYDRAAIEKSIQQLYDSPAYCVLLEHQQRLDELIVQRRAAIREAMAKPERMRTRVRVTVTHVQHPTEPQDPPSWSLLIHGRNLDTADVSSQSQLSTQTSLGAHAQLNAAIEAALKSGAVQDPTQQARIQQLAAAAGTTVASAVTAVAAGLPATTVMATTNRQPLTAHLKRVEVKLRPLQSSSNPAAMETDGAAGGWSNQTDTTQDGLSGRGGASEPGVRTLVWDRSVHMWPHKECVEVRFQGTGVYSAGAEATITLVFEGQPERYVLPTPLDTLLGVAMETKPRIVQLLSQYLKKERLLDRDQQVTLSDALRQVLGDSMSDTVPYQQLLTEVFKTLQPAPPITVHYTISGAPSPSGTGTTGSAARPQPANTSSAPVVLDVECDTLSPLNAHHEKHTQHLFEQYNLDRELEGVEGEMSTLLRRLSEHRRRRAMLLGFAQSPVDFMAALLATQAKDVRITKGIPPATIAPYVPTIPGQLPLPPHHPSREPSIALIAANMAKEFEPMRYTELFKGKWVEDAVVAYLAKRHGRG